MEFCEAAESFENEINITNEEAKTVKKSHFVQLSEDDLDVITDCAGAQAVKNATKWEVKLFEGKHKKMKSLHLKVIYYNSVYICNNLSSKLETFTPQQ